MTLEEANKWPDLLRIIEENVKPTRNLANRKAHRERWWQYGETRPGLTNALKSLQTVFAVSRVYSRWAIARVPANAIFSESLVVFATENYFYFGVLQSFAHEIWARTYGSSLGTGHRYTPTDCLKSFPFPSCADSISKFSMEFIERRERIMSELNLGFTKIYNQFHDPLIQSSAIEELRQLHQRLDHLIFELYGWSDLCKPRDFYDASVGEHKSIQFTYSPEIRKEILTRLINLNKEEAQN
jgi:hypothetical protein